jgi:DNA invertase Pin-like site-specific DNA recombinase
MTNATTQQRAGTYSRYSSDNQLETSIEDQERLQDRRADQDGIAIVARFSDMEVSASVPTMLRQGGRAMVAAALRGDFDVLLIEGLDRCWRDIVDQEQMIRELEFAGIRIIGISDGYDTRHEGRELTRGVRGVVNQDYLRDLAKKVHRGLSGQIARGGHAGGISFGYRSIEAGKVRHLEVEDEPATWVRWIFDRYAEGWSCQHIASELNRKGVKTRKGGTWSVSALYGSPNKGSGVLNNEIYIGRYIWNRSRWVKHPKTHKWVRLVRPENEWVIEQRPELRIVSDEQWAAARERMDAGRLGIGVKGSGSRARSLFGGLMVCGECGGAVVAVSGSTYGCAARKDRGTTVCTGVRVGRDATDRRLLAVLREDLLSPASVSRMRESAAAFVDRHRKGTAAAARQASAALETVQTEISRLVDAIAATGHSDALLTRLREAEARKEALAIQTVQRPVVQIRVDALMAAYRRQLLTLEEALKADFEKARPLLREYFGEIKIEETTDSAWAAFAADPGRLLLKAVGDSRSGCGGAILHPEPRRFRLK